MLNLDSSTKEFAFAFFNRNLILLSLIEKEKEKKITSLNKKHSFSRLNKPNFGIIFFF